jgi:hypothetical protein
MTQNQGDKISDEVLTEAHEWVGTYAHIAIRVQSDVPADGTELPPSRVWVDGEPTAELLAGTCALGLESARRYGEQYPGAVVVVVGSDREVEVYTSDPGEVLLDSPVALAAWVNGQRAY